MEWNYTSKSESSNGYEDVLDKLNPITLEEFNKLNEDEQDKVADDILKEIRKKNIFPITYYNNDGIKKEIQKCIDKEVVLDGNVMDIKFNQGQGLCRFLFPNIELVEATGDKRTMWNKFYDDHLLKRTLKFIMRDRKVTPSNIYSGMRLVGGGNPMNFAPMKAKALYERYCPENGVIYDFSCGFGGRMLGALSSKKNFRYLGVEPCTETFEHLNELGVYIEQVTGRENSFKVVCSGSEDYCPKENFVDFAFSSPPYFNCEKYSEEETQCYNRFNTVDSWFEGYVRPTIENTYKMLKDGAYYAVNIADFNLNGNSKTPIHFVERWKQISEDVGFVYVEEISMKLKPRRQKAIKKQEEGIFVFKKSNK